MNGLFQIQEKFELFANFPPILILYGPGGSGKTALVKVLLREMCDHIGLEQNLSHKWILQVLREYCIVFMKLSLIVNTLILAVIGLR